MDKLFHFDVHFHADSLIMAGARVEPFDSDNFGYVGIVSCHSVQDFQRYESLALEFQETADWQLRASVGIHPEFLDLTDLTWCRELVEKHKVVALGESGFDFFDGRNPSKFAAQEKAFLAMVDLAIDSRLPLILHVRKATDCLFKHLRRLRAVSGIVIHSTSLAENEVKSLLDKGLSIWFSFGTPVLWAGPRLQKTIAAVPLNRLLTETDAPCQPVRGQNFTQLSDLCSIEKALADAKQCDVIDLLRSVHQSFRSLGFIHGTF